MKLCGRVLILCCSICFVQCWLFEIEHQGLTEHNQHRKPSARDLATLQQLAESGEIENPEDVPNILMRILRSDRDYDGPLRDLHGQAATMNRRLSFLRRSRMF